MTKKELAEKMREFVAAQNNGWEDEWYASDRVIYGAVIDEFAKWLNVDLTKEKEE
jgi:hypothetical protein